MNAKSPAERKREERERMRSKGFSLRQVWVHPRDWPLISKYLARVRKNRS